MFRSKYESRKATRRTRTSSSARVKRKQDETRNCMWSPVEKTWSPVTRSEPRADWRRTEMLICRKSRFWLRTAAQRGYGCNAQVIYDNASYQLEKAASRDGGRSYNAAKEDRPLHCTIRVSGHGQAAARIIGGTSPPKCVVDSTPTSSASAPGLIP